LTLGVVSQYQNGPLAINQVGDLRVTGLVSSGPQTINVTGGLVVQPEALGFALLSANGSQSINAHFIEVNATGGAAGILSFGDDQRIANGRQRGGGRSRRAQSRRRVRNHPEYVWTANDRREERGSRRD
jgi:hypothetical protein